MDFPELSECAARDLPGARAPASAQAVAAAQVGSARTRAAASIILRAAAEGPGWLFLSLAL